MVALAGCESTSSGPATATSPSPRPPRSNIATACDLFTKAQAETAAGTTFAIDPGNIRKQYGAECRYDSQQGVVSVQLEDGAGVAAGRSAFGGPDGVPQAGVGDEAFWNPGFDVLWTRKAGKAVTIQVVNAAITKDVLRDHAMELARQILPKL